MITVRLLIRLLGGCLTLAALSMTLDTLDQPTASGGSRMVDGKLELLPATPNPRLIARRDSRLRLCTIAGGLGLLMILVPDKARTPRRRVFSADD